MRRTRLLARAIVLVSMIGVVVGSGSAQAVTTQGRICTIVGTAGVDRLIGKAGNDVICGLGGNDRIYGLAGNDVIDGGAGDDLLWGGFGRDVIVGGLGLDTAYYDDHTAAVAVTMDGRADDGNSGEGDNVLTDMENLIGTRANDVLVGNALPNRISGQDGHDRLLGGAGDDTLMGGNGNDVIAGGDGRDGITGNVGDDRLSGERGNDRIDDDGPREVINGGPDLDWCLARATVVPTGCEARDTTRRIGGPSAIIAGVLRDAAGAPVVGAVVTDGYHQVLTDAQGAWGHLLAVRSGRINPFTFQLHGGTDRPVSWTGSPPGVGDGFFTVVLPVRRDVVIRLQDETGAPAPGIETQLLNTGGVPPLTGLPGFVGAEGGVYGPTDAAGEHRFPSYRTVLPGLDFVLGPQHTGPSDVPVPQDGIVLQVIDRRPVAVTGVVRDATGAPAAGVLVVTPHGPESAAISEEDGVYALAATRTPQAIQVRPFNRPGQPRDLVMTSPVFDLRAGDRALDVELPPNDTLIVHVQDTSGAPVPEVTVTFPGYDPGTVTTAGTTWQVTQRLTGGTTDSAGDVRVPVVGSPRASVRLEVGSIETGYISQLFFSAVTDNRAVFTVDTRRATVSGPLLDGTGQPVSGGRVSWYRQDGAGQASVPTRPDGTFTLLAPAGPGRFVLEGTAGDGVPARVSLGVTTTLEQDVSGPLRLPARVPVTLRVLDAAGSPVSGARLGHFYVTLDPVSVHPDLPMLTGQMFTESADLVSDGQGQLTVGLLPGTFSVSASATRPDGWPTQGSLSQVPVGSSPITVDIRLSP